MIPLASTPRAIAPYPKNAFFVDFLDSNLAIFVDFSVFNYAFFVEKGRLNLAFFEIFK